MSTIREGAALKTRTADGKEAGPPEPLSERVRALRLPSQVAATGSTGRSLAWVLCSVLAVSTALLGYLLATRQAGQASARGEKAGAESSPDGAPGQNAKDAGDIVLEAKGYIVAAHQILVSPKVAGMIVRLGKNKNGEPFREGTQFDRGDILAEVEEDDYLADRDRAAANLASAVATRAEMESGYRQEEREQATNELAEAKAQQVQMLADWDRAVKLWEKKVISREDYDSALSRRQQIDRRVDRLDWAWKMLDKGYREERKAAAKAAVRQAEAELAKAEWRLKNCKIRAPVSGTILKKNAEEGNLVNPIAMQGSYSLCEMADLRDLEVDLSIQERDLSKSENGVSVPRIFKNQKCRIRTDAFPDRKYDGEVSRLMPIADRAKGAMPVRVKVHIPDNETGLFLKPEMGAIVSFLDPKKTQGKQAKD